MFSILGAALQEARLEVAGAEASAPLVFLRVLRPFPKALGGPSSSLATASFTSGSPQFMFPNRNLNHINMLPPLGRLEETTEDWTGTTNDPYDQAPPQTLVADQPGQL